MFGIKDRKWQGVTLIGSMSLLVSMGVLIVTVFSGIDMVRLKNMKGMNAKMKQIEREIRSSQATYTIPVGYVLPKTDVAVNTQTPLEKEQKKPASTTTTN